MYTYSVCKSTSLGVSRIQRVIRLYNTPHYNMYWSYCGSQMFLPWNFTKELQEIYHEVVIFL